MNDIIDSLVNEIIRQASKHQRMLVAIAGPPGSGKSTLAEALLAHLIKGGQNAQILPMDGFHLDNGLLTERGMLSRKGAPETFDVRGFFDIARAIRAGDEEVLVPIFDRSREITIGAARSINHETKIVLIEGNYLLLNEAPWSRLESLFDMTVFVNPGEPELARRLRRRWISYGFDEETITTKVESNDMPNGRRVIANSRKADISIGEW
jgi:pantothenate kinase